ncbi:hypothetical protein CB1_001232007 [Camelus ferus]|nr:hypothetical protein CB1_001232007 [Camelus ferus]
MSCVLISTLLSAQVVNGRRSTANWVARTPEEVFPPPRSSTWENFGVSSTLIGLSKHFRSQPGTGGLEASPIQVSTRHLFGRFHSGMSMLKVRHKRRKKERVVRKEGGWIACGQHWVNVKALADIDVCICLDLRGAGDSRRQLLLQKADVCTDHRTER